MMVANGCRQMALGTIDQREKDFFKDAPRTIDMYSDPTCRLLAVHILVTETANSAVMTQIENWDNTIRDFKARILEEGLSKLACEPRKQPLALQVALAALASLEPERVKSEVRAVVPELLEHSNFYLGSGIPALGWEIRTFLARFFPEVLGPSPLKTGLPATVNNRSLLLEYVDAVVGEVDEETKLGYLQEALEDIENEGPDSNAHLLIVERLIQHTKGTSASVIPQEQTDTC